MDKLDFVEIKIFCSLAEKITETSGILGENCCKTQIPERTYILNL